jgi:predicted transcriptional regulator
MNRGRPVKPEAKRQRNQRVIRLNDFYSAALDEIAEADGSNASAIARKFIQEGIRRRLAEKRDVNGGRATTA